MRIGIITLQYAHNYGAFLQVYALKNVLENLGHDVIVINYVSEKEKDKYSFKLKRTISIKECIKKFKLQDLVSDYYTRAVSKNDWEKRYYGFTEYIEKYVLEKHKYCEYDTKEKIEKMDLDFFICGSDQIWNPNIVGDDLNIYFADFSLNAKKISYAASVGQIENINNDVWKKIIAYLENFKCVSVREEILARKINDFIEKKVAEEQCDPTFLLETKYYDKLIPDGSNAEKEKPYVLAYFLREDSLMEQVVDLYRNKGKNVLEIHWNRNIYRNYKFQRNSLSVGEFLDYLKNADQVITNSFHGTVFSILYHKQFYSVYDKNVRIDNLLSNLNLTNRKIHKENVIKNDLITSWDKIDLEILEMRNSGLKFLEEALEK